MDNTDLEKTGVDTENNENPFSLVPAEFALFRVLILGFIFVIF